MDIAAYAALAAAANPMPYAKAPAPVAGLVAHVDGDYCAYYCAGNDDTDPGQARRNLLGKLESIKFATGATSVVVHITDHASKKGDRFIIATVKPYQGQRKTGRKPKNWAHLREYMEGYDGTAFRVKNWTEREADDGIAYVAHAAAMNGTLAVIATCDKDMRMLPGRHYIWKTGQIVDVPLGCFDLIGPDEEQYGHKWFWLQMLHGDDADYIPGLPGYISHTGKVAQCGKATAGKLLRDVTCNEEAYQVVSGLYMGYYGDEWPERFAEQAMLLWLRTDREATHENFAEMLGLSDKPNVKQGIINTVLRVADAKRELEAIAA